MSSQKLCGPAYSQTVAVYLVGLVLKYLPQCFNDWEEKFSLVRQLKFPTGNSNMPEHVKEAKHA
eukprot:614172-Ditylum_brightwellii.AAC.1